jgi:hypothetical protein
MVLEPARPLAVSRRAFLTATPPPAVADAGHWIHVHRRAMACRFEITLASEHAAWVAHARATLDEIDRIEAQLSVFRDTSAISDVNRRAVRDAVEIDTSFFDLLRHCAILHGDTGGAFDITSTPLSRCWGFLQRAGRLPSLGAIDAARVNPSTACSSTVGPLGAIHTTGHRAESWRDRKWVCARLCRDRPA